MPECYVDTNLIEYLVKAGVNHQHSCTKVVGLLKNNFADKFAIGIIDKFILDSAKEQNVTPETYGLPSDLKEFTQVSKSVTSNNDTRFKELFEDIKDNYEIKVLRRVLKYLSDNQYKVDMETLKGLF